MFGSFEKLQEAIELNDLDMVDVLLTPSIIDRPDEEGMTPLMLAAQAQLPDMVAFLISRGANPEITDNLGLDAMGIACFNGETDGGDLSQECVRIIDTLTRAGLQII